MVEWRSKRTRAALAPLSFIDPAQPVRADKPPAGADWIHEIKHDGFRLQIHKRGKIVKLYTMTGVDWTRRYPWIAQGALDLKADHAIVDAEAVVADESGVTIFDRMIERIHNDSAFAYAFDLLAVDGANICALPIEERKAWLAKMIPRRKLGLGIKLNEHLPGDGPLVFAQACRLGLEGIVSKRLGSKYRSGRCLSWVKVKNRRAPGFLRHVQGE